MQLSDYLENLAVNHLLRNQAHTPTAQVFAALYSDATTDAGGGTEAVGGSYARQVVTLGAPVNGEASNSVAVDWLNMPAGAWTHIAILDAVTGGNMLFHGPLGSTKTTIAGQNLTLAPGELDVGFTAGSHATDTLRDLIINRFLRNQAHTPTASLALGLYSTATTRTGGGTELTGGSYARQTMAFTAPSGGATSNTAQLDFTALPAGDIVALGVHNSGGTMLLWGPWSSIPTLAAGDNARVPLGDLDLTVR